ncbi:MAG: LamG-like jellyroll fold domain-containing protein [Myxococcota bacterium]
MGWLRLWLVCGLVAGAAACASDGSIAGGDGDAVALDAADVADGDGVADGGDGADLGPDVPGVECSSGAECQVLVANDPCRVALCDTLKHRCVVGPKKDYTPCSDGDRCTDGDLCLDGECSAGPALPCGDGDPCTDNDCDPQLGCVYPDNTAPCSDGNTCTDGDVCAEGLCAGTPTASCGCDTDADCVQHDDGDLCNGVLTCHEGVCANDPTTVVQCDTSGDTDCFRTVCLPETGACSALLLDDVPCNDGNGCTVGDRCASGTCTSGADQCPCDKDADCAEYDDDDLCNGSLGCIEGRCRIAPLSIVICEVPGSVQCIRPRCVPATGACVSEAQVDGVACSDANACTQGDVCAAGACVPGAPRVCADGLGCTDDACDPATGCTFTPNTAPCDDADACTEGDLCAGGLCTPGAAVDCDDGDPCTADACAPAVGCTHTVTPAAACDDEDPCTEADACSAAGACVGTAYTCATCEACDGAGGCALFDEFCKIGGACVASGAVDPANPCQRCTPEITQAAYAPDDALSCDDGAECTTDDFCSAGFCTGAGSGCAACETCGEDGGCVLVAGACRIDGACLLAGAPHPTLPCLACVPEVSTSAWSPDDAMKCADEDACNGVETCSAGVCTPGAPLVCDDADPCTDDACDAATGCTATDNTAPCDDENACTDGDTCAAGTCAGTAILCDDENPCTDDGCEPAIGCVTADNVAPCDDSDACTSGDLCAGGACGGAAITCDDKDPCTDDACEPATGCTTAPNTAPCDDQNACTDGDTCAAGTCAGSAIVCDDENPCTDDGCDVATGCTATPNSAGCDDASVCTTGDHCAGGACVGDAIDCDDGNPCTGAFCDDVFGCIPDEFEDGTPCFSELICAAPGTCLGLVCQCPSPDCSGLATDCADAAWDAVAQKCVTTPKNQGGACNGDDNGCTPDTCAAGVCVVGAPQSCVGSADPCNASSCTSVTPFEWVCVPAPVIGLACDDATTCTASGTTCLAGAAAAYAYNHAAVTSARALDRSGKGNHMTLSAATTLKSGGPTGAFLHCDGTGEAFIASAPSLEITSPGLTVGTWFRSESVLESSRVMVSKDTSFMLGLNTGVLSCAIRIDDEWAWYGSTAVPPNTWHHGACTYDGQRLEVWLDGVRTDTVEMPGLLTPTEPTTRLCARKEGFRFLGDLADTRIYPRALGAGELWTLASAPQVWRSGGGTCGGKPWPSSCCETNAHCEDRFACTAESCNANACTSGLATLCDIPGNGCRFEYCAESVTGTPACEESFGGPSDPIATEDFELWSAVGPRANGFFLEVGPLASPECAWHHVSGEDVAAQLTPLGCSEGFGCLYAGSLVTWDYDVGVCDATATTPPIQIPTASTAHLEFARWGQILDTSAGGDRLEILIDGAVIKTINATALSTGGWTNDTSTISAFADGKAHRIGFRFRTDDDAFNTGGGVLIDNLRIRLNSPSCL